MVPPVGRQKLSTQGQMFRLRPRLPDDRGDGQPLA